MNFCFQVSFRYHIQVIKEWRSVNQRICVINKKEINDNNLLSKSNIEQQCSLLHTFNHDTVTSQIEENILPEICIVK